MSKFTPYYNEDGTIGKVYKLGGGATLKVNDRNAIPFVEKAMRDFEEESLRWHNILLSMGAKSYRVNDGWVDRKNCIVTFFNEERTKGHYWFDPQLKVGDKIFIGCEFYGGRFAIVTEYLSHSCGYSFKYKPLDETMQRTISGKKKPYLTKNNVRWWHYLIAIIKSEDLHLSTDIYNED